MLEKPVPKGGKYFYNPTCLMEWSEGWHFSIGENDSIELRMKLINSKGRGEEIG